MICSIDLRKLVASPAGPAGNQELRVGSMVSLDHLEEQHIRRVVENSTNLNEAANVLGIDLATLYRKRKKMNQSGKSAAAEAPATAPAA